MTKFKFNTVAAAKNSISHSILPSKYSIVMGDDMKFWVVTNREASILKKQGFEIFED